MSPYQTKACVQSPTMDSPWPSLTRTESESGVGGLTESSDGRLCGGNTTPRGELRLLDRTIGADMLSLSGSASLSTRSNPNNSEGWLACPVALDARNGFVPGVTVAEVDDVPPLTDDDMVLVVELCVGSDELEVAGALDEFGFLHEI